MLKCVHRFRHVFQLASIRLTLTVGALHYLGLCLHPSPALAAKALFLRTQLALYQERPVKPQRPTNGTRIALVWLGRRFDWRPALYEGLLPCTCGILR
jgi:putative transposase